MKSETEKKFDELCDQYSEKFGKDYGICIGDGKSLQDHIKILQEALETGKPVENTGAPVDDNIY